MKVELVVNGLSVAEFEGTFGSAMQFQAAIYQYMAEAQSEWMNSLNKQSRMAFSKLNEIQFGITKTVPTDPHSADPKA